ncbi:MAG: orotidine-5'-phosphate decarboxylase [Patescibacteria group bacterium]|jgi:orotidine 5'-phosphate decarboxylase subfamily 1
MTYTQKAEKTMNPAAKKLLLLMEEKRTNLCVAADMTTRAELLTLAEAVGPYIVMLKTHIDIIEDFSSDLLVHLRTLAKQHHFMLFEDRKFADIGNTLKLQYAKGVHRIVEWADFVNAHALPGPGVIEALKETAAASGEERGLILLAQMTPKGNLFTEEYTKQTVEFAAAYPDFVIGFIANGGDVTKLAQLAAIASPEHILFAPGVKIGGGGDRLGQQYTTPADVIAAGADIIISGRGVYTSKNPAQAAREYREAGWNAYHART